MYVAITNNVFVFYIDSAEKIDSSEVSVNNDTKEETSVEDDDGTSEDGDSNEDDGPMVEVSDEPYLPHSSAENLVDVDDSKEVETHNTDDRDSTEQTDDSKHDDNGDSKETETASADETAEQGIWYLRNKY